MALTLGKKLRLSQIIDQSSGTSLILEADQGLALGPAPGVEDLASTLKGLKGLVDAVILSKGQVGRAIDAFKGRGAPALIIRADWTSAFRGGDFVLPAKGVTYAPSAGAEEALTLGASGVASHLFVGYERDEDEAANVRSIAGLARECEECGVPLLVEAIPRGERVTKENYLDCARFAARVAVEVGADLVATPYKRDPNVVRKVVEGTRAPTLVLEVDEPVSREGLKGALEAGASGLIIGKKSIGSGELPKLLDGIKKLMRG